MFLLYSSRSTGSKTAPHQNTTCNMHDSRYGVLGVKGLTVSPPKILLLIVVKQLSFGGKESCYAGLRWSLNKWVLSLLQKMESDSAVLTLVWSSLCHWGAKTEKSCDLDEQSLFALSNGGTSRPADVVERSSWIFLWPCSLCSTHYITETWKLLKSMELKTAMNTIEKSIYL